MSSGESGQGRNADVRREPESDGKRVGGNAARYIRERWRDIPHSIREQDHRRNVIVGCRRRLCVIQHLLSIDNTEADRRATGGVNIASPM